MFKTAAALLALLAILALSSCRKLLVQHAVITRVEVLSYQNKTWDLTTPPDIYCILSDSPATRQFFSTKENYYQDVSLAQLPKGWDLRTEVPSSGTRFLLELYDRDETSSELMGSVTFFLQPPADLSKSSATTQIISHEDTRIRLTVNWE